MRTRHLACALSVGILVGVSGLGLGPVPSAAAVPTVAEVRRQLPPPVVNPIGDVFGPPIGTGPAPEVATVPATSSTIDPLRRELDGVEQQLSADNRQLETARGESAEVVQRRAALEQLVARRTEQLAHAEQARDRASAALQSLASQRFVRGDHLMAGLDPALSAQEHEDLAVRKAFTSAATRGRLGATGHTGATVQRLSSELALFSSALEETSRRGDELTTRIDALTRSISEGMQRSVTLATDIDAARLSADVEGTDMSVMALDAYWRAARLMAVVRPDCGMQWWMLAGIGRVESRHGTYRSSLGPDGVADPPFYGPDLDGSNPRFRVIPDSDGGVLDGTSRTDRAVGPMQFLPGTWRTNAMDNSGDEVADPQNIYDAAAASGIYLCRKGPGLGDESRLREAYFSYNRSATYVDDVTSHAHGYRDAVPLP